jgi:hypothetical protein
MGSGSDRTLSRRQTLAAALSAVFGYRYANDYVTFAVDPERYIEPEHPEVEDVADQNDDLTDEVDLGIDYEYHADAEWFRPAGNVLEHGGRLDCEDLAMVAASVLENEDRDWKMVVQPGHTETHFQTDDGVYRWHVGAPEDPEPRGDQDWTLMYDLDDGFERYEEDWG